LRKRFLRTCRSSNSRELIDTRAMAKRQHPSDQ
jgi:hypothetical protein